MLIKTISTTVHYASSQCQCINMAQKCCKIFLGLFVCTIPLLIVMFVVHQLFARQSRVDGWSIDRSIGLFVFLSFCPTVGLSMTILFPQVPTQFHHLMIEILGFSTEKCDFYALCVARVLTERYLHFSISTLRRFCTSSHIADLLDTWNHSHMPFSV